MTSKPQLLLANDAGGGRGHIISLATFIPVFQDICDICAVTPLGRYKDLIEALGVRAIDGPQMGFMKGNPPESCAAYGDYLADLGLARPERLRDLIGWWRKTILAADASILIADYAPSALLAAQGLRAEGWQIAIFSTGMGYGLAPTHLPRFPILHPEQGAVRHDDADMVAMINAVSAEFSVPPLTGYPEVLKADLSLVRTLAMLDPYRDTRIDPLISPVTALTAAAGGEGDEAFIYFSGNELCNPAIVSAISNLPIPRRAYLPFPMPDQTAQLAASGVIIEPSPLTQEQIRQNSRILIHAGQHGSLCMGLYAGLPQIALPTDLERLAHATNAAAEGGAAMILPRTSDAIRDVVLSTYESTAAKSRALDIAHDLRAAFPADRALDLRARMRPVCQAAGVVI